MNPKNFLVLGSIVVIGAISYISISPKDESKNEQDLQIIASGYYSSSSANQNINSEQATTKHDVNLIEPPLGDFTNNENNEPTNVWKPASGDFRKAPSQYQHLDNIEVDRAFIKVNRQSISSLQQGNHFKVGIPQTNNVYDVKTEEIEYHTNGDKTVRGVIQEGNGQSFSVTFTQGKHATFGTLSTPEGVYIMEGGDVDGWLASKADLIKNRNHDVPDYLEHPNIEDPEPDFY